jgi:hypothetical integral membrane protein (TIGR02206 family)
MFDEKYARDFALFGWEHILILAVAAGSLVAMYYLRGYLKIPAVGRVFRYTVATGLLAGESTFFIWTAWMGRLRPIDMVPLGLCHIVNWTTIIALFFDLKGVIKVILPWAFAGATLSFIVVEMGETSYAFPHFRFFHYFGNHWLFLIGNLFYLYTGRFTYTSKDLLKSSAWLFGVSLVDLAVSLATDTNYMFLVKWPEELDFINKLFPFPLNTVMLMIGIFVMFNIFYLLFVIKRFDRAESPVASQTPPAVLTVS